MNFIFFHCHIKSLLKISTYRLTLDKKANKYERY